MNPAPSPHDHEHAESIALYALHALPASEAPGVEARIAACPDCRRELDALRPLVGAFVAWPTNVLRPAAPLWERLARRIAAETGRPAVVPEPPRQPKPDWEDVAPGISCKLLATDPERQRVSMLVRLAPGTDYPPHRHGGVEELHLLDGELIVDERKLYPGDYIHAEAGSVDHRVWSETGCTCVLITSTQDVLF
jgi:anti-sigma factor ChrR (cupin superfamily)